MAILARYDDEPYYFPDATALLKALHRSAGSEKVKVAPTRIQWLERSRLEDRGTTAAATHLPSLFCHDSVTAEMEKVRTSGTGVS